MFSEYASRFLAQSQSRLSSFGQPVDDTASVTADPSGRARSDGTSARGSSRPFGRSFFGRGFAGGPSASIGPYQTAQATQTGVGSRFGQLNFASRYSTAAPDAPLFHNARSDLHEQLGEDEDNEDEMERDREAADLYALQRSRRVFAASRLDDSLGTDNERSRTSLGESRDMGKSSSNKDSNNKDGDDSDDSQELLSSSDRRIRALARSMERRAAASSPSRDDDNDAFGPARDVQSGRVGGIHSSWKGSRSFFKTATQRAQDRRAADRGGSESPESSGPKDKQDKNKKDKKDKKGRKSNLDESQGNMVDIGLESVLADSEPPEDLTVERPLDHDDHDDPPAFQTFHPASKTDRFGLLRNSTGESQMGLLHETASTAGSVDGYEDSEALHPAADNDDGESALPLPDGELFRHDPFFAWVYLVAIASLFSTFLLVYLHTTTPTGGKKPAGDTIYTTLLASFHLLAIDTLVAVAVSLVWLAALRSFARHLVTLIVVAVPIILLSFTIYPFVASFQRDGSSSGSSRLQDTMMRWATIVPGTSAVLWVYLVYRGRSALRAAVDILEFASRILAANSGLVLVGLGCLGLVVLWTWAWLAMFTRIFLGGSFSSQLSRFIISASSWWLGAYFVLMYIWTLSVISGVQRSTTGATVSQWYFHRNAQPTPSSSEVVSAALHHALTTIFGSICLSTLLALLIRLPLLVLPRRLADAVGLFFYAFVPSPMAALTNPLTLTYTAIHSQSLATSAQGLSHLDFLSPQAPTTTLTPRAFQGAARRQGGVASMYPTSSAPLLPYRLAKLLLHATRFIMATALGFAGWVMTARQLRVTVPDGGSGSTLRGSAYAYVVGLVASFIGWGVLGAMEGILSGIVDAVVICYGSETRMHSGGGGYCMEAAYLFGGRSMGAAGSDSEDDYRQRHVY